MGYAWQWVDDGLDRLVAADPTIVDFDRNDLAGVLGLTPSHVSHLLQYHRRAQRSGKTRYVVAARDYARATRWFILAAPHLSTGTRRRRQLTMGHAEHVATDAARRVISDIKSELDPALLAHPAITAFLTHAEAAMANDVRRTCASVRAAVELVEQVTSETADRTKVKAP